MHLACIAVENDVAERMNPAQSNRVPSRFGVSRMMSVAAIAASTPTGTFKVKIGRKRDPEIEHPDPFQRAGHHSSLE